MSHARKNARSLARAALGATALAALLAMSAVGATSAVAKTLAKVNGVEITDEDLKLAMEDLGAAIPRQLEGKARETYVLDFLIDEQLVVQKAQADKLAETPEFAKKLAYLRDKALMETLLGDVAKNAATEAAVKQTYDEAAKNQKPETEYHAHHILVPTEEEAKAALKRIKAGEDFGKVATELSKDPAPRAATSAGSPRTAWCRSSATRRRRWSRVRSPIRLRRNSDGTSLSSTRNARKSFRRSMR